MKHRRSRFLKPHQWVVLALAAVTTAAMGQYPASFSFTPTTLRGDNFQSHNQKIVHTANGLFRSGQVQDGNTREIVERSTDGGSSWSLLLDIGFDNRPATIEADEDANVYVIYPEPANNRTRFVKFSAANNYASPVVNRTHSQASSASKFASFYDQGRQRIYHATQWGYLFTFDKSGGFVRGQQVFTGSATSGPSYPHLFVDESGIVHYAMTTADAADAIPYETIRYLKSLDGGQTWRAMNGTAVSIPTTCNPNGPSTMINLPGEENYQTWLACMHVKNGKAHFVYQTRNPANPAGAGNPPSIASHVHYMRFDVASGAREIDSSPNGEGWSGDTLRVNDYSASFASDPADPAGPLYAVGKDGNRLNALISHDNGTSWHDYARSGWYSTLANPGLYRAITPEGKVIGCVATSDPWWATVNFFEFRAVPPPAPTTVFVGSSANPALVGSDITFTATVRTNGVMATAATGSIIFRDRANAVHTNVVSGGVAQWTISTLAYGSHSITAEYSGDASHAASTNSPPLAQVMTNPPNRITFTVSIASSSDDAEEYSSGTVNLTSTDLELVNDNGTGAGDQTIGLRFANLAIPNGAYIVGATIQFTTDEVQTNATALTIRAQAVDNAPTFTASNTNISARPRTAAAVTWSPPPWTTAGEAAAAQQTPDLANVLQEVAGRPGWVSGNAVAFIITGAGHRTAESFDKTGGTPARLTVTFRPAIEVLPRFTGIQQANDGTVTLAWASQPGRSYTIQTSRGLTSWTNFVSSVPAGGNLTSLVIPAGSSPDPGTEPCLFFRIRQE